MMLNKLRSHLGTKVGLIFLTGLLIKLLLMPFAMHADLLSMYWRANLMVTHDIWLLPTNQYLAHLIYAFNLIFMKLIGFDLAAIFPTEHFGLSVGSMTASVGDWLRFNELSNLNPVLFFLKLPHLLADILVFTLLYKLLQHNKHRPLALALWWLNPVNLYAFYIFSRHDAITLVFVLAALVFAIKHYLTASLLILFAAIQVRVQPLMLVPIFLADYWKNRQNLTRSLQQALIAGVIMLVYLSLNKFIPANSETLNRIITPQPQVINTLSALGIPQQLIRRGFDSNIFSLPTFAITYIITLFLSLKLSKSTTPKSHLKHLNLALLAVTSAYFATQIYSPHYFAWLSLFPIIATVFSLRYSIPYSLALIFWGLSGLLAPGSFSLNQNLFLPISNILFYTPQLPDLINASPLGNLITAQSLHTIFSTLLRLTLAIITLQALLDLSGKKIPQLKILTIIALPILSLSLIPVSPAHAALIPAIDNGRVEDSLGLGNLTVEQTFTSPVDSFGAVQVKFNTHKNQSPTKINFRIKSTQSDDWWYQASYDTADFYNLAYYPFGFPQITNALGQEFIFQITADPPSTHLGLATNSDYHQGNLYVDGKSTQSDLAFRLDQNQPLSQVVGVINNDLIHKHEQQPVFFTFYYTLIMLTLAATLYSGLSIYQTSRNQ